MAEEILKVMDLDGGTYNQTTRKITKIEDGEKNVVVRKESNFLNKSLINEIRFLLSLEQKVKSHLPEVRKYQINKLPVFYEMPYYNLKSLKKNIIMGNVNSAYCVRVIQNILNFTFKDIFSKNIQRNSPDILIKRTILRVNQRHKQLCKVSSIMKPFIKAKSFIIEGKEYKNIPKMIDWFTERPKLIKKLTPKKTHMIHGDFHFDNFLIDTKNPAKFILLDPRGETNGFDYGYDLGRLWWSFHGLYDLIQEWSFDVEYKISDNMINASIFKPRKSKALKVYQNIYTKRDKFIGICTKHLREDNIELQILFNEAMHFCAIAPFHLKNDGVEKEMTCRYIMAVKLLNEFIDKLKR